MSGHEFSRGVAKLQQTLSRLLFNTRNATVIGITGAWGAGKTHFWNKFIEDKRSTVAPGYVSVFGCESLEEIRRKVIFEAIRKAAWKSVELKGPKPDIGLFKYIKGIQDILVSLLWHIYFLLLFFKTSEFLIKKIVNNLRWLIKKVPEALHTFIIPRSISVEFMEAKILGGGWVLCIDDIERLSRKIKINDFAGYVNQLRDGMNINIVLIYSKDRINNKTEFNKVSEKLVDREIYFSPELSDSIKLSYEESKYIANNEPLREEIIKSHSVLSLNNMRIMMRNRSYIDEILDSLEIEDVEKSFIHTIVASVIIISWVINNPDNMHPWLSWLKGYSPVGSLLIENKITQEEKMFYKTLSDYGYRHTDDLDLLLIEYIQTGWFDENDLKGEYNKFKQDDEQRKINSDLTHQYKLLYHTTFEDNSTSVTGSLLHIAIEHAGKLSSNQVNEIATTFSELGLYDCEIAVVDEFIGTLSEDNFLMRTRNDRAPSIESAYLIKRLKQFKVRMNADFRCVHTVIESILSSDHLVYKNASRFNKFSVEELFDYLISRNYEETHLTTVFRHLAIVFTHYEGTLGPDCKKLFMQVAHRIANEHRINYLRIQRIEAISQDTNFITH